MVHSVVFTQGPLNIAMVLMVRVHDEQPVFKQWPRGAGLHNPLIHTDPPSPSLFPSAPNYGEGWGRTLLFTIGIFSKVAFDPNFIFLHDYNLNDTHLLTRKSRKNSRKN